MTSTSTCISNPLNQTATVDLRVRRVDIPTDWIVSTDWLSARLPAGQQKTATVTIIPASASVQGTQPKVAIEGYIGDELIGGVVLSVLAFRVFLAFSQHCLISVS